MRQLEGERREALRPAQIAPGAEAQGRYVQGMHRLVEVVQELSLARTLGAVMAIVRSAARQLTGADGATFVLREGDRCYYADEDAIEPLWKGRRFPLSACISGWAMLNRQPAVIPDIYVDPRIPIDAYRPTFVRSLVMVPIRAQQPIGAIGNYWAHCREATPEELRLLEALAHSTSVALENVELVNNLEQRVAERTAELHVANQELAVKNAALTDLQEQKEALSALLVHDIRSPAATIVMAAEMQLDDPALSARERRPWMHVLASGEAIARMATNLLDIAQAERAGLALEPVPLDAGELVRAAVEAMNALAESRDQQIDVDVPPAPLELCADYECLRRVLQNLIENALRYSPAQSRLRVCARRLDEATVGFDVCDEGPGVPLELRERIFEKYVRLGRSGAGDIGRGLGLSFCRLAVEAHGGRVFVEANEPKGSRFRVVLPGPLSTPSD